MINEIILASSSPRRKEILTNLGLKFNVVTPNCDEEIDNMLPPGEYVETLAERKGRNVLEKLKAKGTDLSDKLIVSCDTIVYFDYGQSIILGKPKDDREAYLMLSLLSDSWHSVYSGLCLISGENEEKPYVSSIETRVKFKMISDAQIDAYIETLEPFGKAGAYGIQLMGGTFVEKIEGDYFNIVGFPVSLFTDMLSVCYHTDIFEIRKNIEKYEKNKK